VISVYGNLISQGSLSGKIAEVDLSIVSGGIYVVNILDQNGRQVRQLKVVKLTL